MEPLLRSLGIAVVMSPADLEAAAAARRAAARRAALCAARPRTLSLSLRDPLRLPCRDRRAAPPRAIPRILSPGLDPHFALAVRPPLSPDDPIPAQRLALRLAALGRVLDDLPRQAERFARAGAAAPPQARTWETTASPRARRWRKTPPSRGILGPAPSPTRTWRRKASPFRRIWPLRPGELPGLRPAGGEMRLVLENTHGLALMALRRDSS